MAPTNAKQEALRLQQAKMAIKKMKEKRREGNRPARASRPSLTVKVPGLTAPVPDRGRGRGQAQNGADILAETMAMGRQVNVNGARVGVKKKPRVRKAKRESPIVVKREHNGHDSEEHRTMAKELGKKSRAALAASSSSVAMLAFDRATTSQAPEVMGESPENAFGLYGISPHSNRKVSPKGGKKSTFGLAEESPFMRASAVKNVYTNKKKCASVSSYDGEHRPFLRGPLSPKFPVENKEPSDCENGVKPSGSCLLKPGKKVKKIKTLKTKRSSLKLKRLTAPMLIKKTSTSVKCPVFSVSLDDSFDRNELKSKSSVKPSSKSSSGSVSTSVFSVTTVSENKLPIFDVSSEEDESSEEEEKNDAQPDAEDLDAFEEGDTNMEEEPTPSESADEYEDIPEKPIAPQKSMNDLSRIKFHFIDGEVILQLEHPTTYTFNGQVEVEVLKGAVEVLGYLLTSASGSCTVFSPRGSSLLTLQTVPTNVDCCVELDSSTVSSFVKKGNEDDVFILMKKSENTLRLFLEQHVEINLFPHVADSDCEDPFSKASRRLQCWCSPTRGSVFQKGDTWDEISQDIIQNSGCSVLCGGKSVGKSTLLRYLVNRLLSNGHDGVVLVDLDPGQAELTVPGCVSVSVVKKPLLGPNFTHLQNTLKCIYVGDVNIGNCVSRYMDASATIINYWQSNKDIADMPCLVNTMGFSKGIGVTIMVQLLSILQPTRVVQIQSKYSLRNYPELLTPEYVKKSCSSSPFTVNVDGPRCSLFSQTNLNYKLNVLKTEADMGPDIRTAMGLDARTSREIVLLSYLAQIVSPPNHSILDAVPYCCPLTSLYLGICHESVPPSITLSAFNANLVALCTVSPQEMDVVNVQGSGLPSVVTKRFSADCLGFGIVRGIDMETQQLYLLTPLAPNVLVSVNCLVLGAISLPQSIYFSPPREPGSVPYVIQSQSQHSNQQFKRTFQFASFNKYNMKS